jgi:ATP-binding cassette subfamily B protein
VIGIGVFLLVCVISVGWAVSERRRMARADVVPPGRGHSRRGYEPTSRSRWREHAGAYIAPDGRAVVLAVWLMLLEAALALAAPWPVKFVIDQVLSGRPLPAGLAPLRHLGPVLLTGVAAVAGLLLLALAAVIGYLVLFLTSAIAERAAARLRAATLTQVLAVPPGELDRFPTGELSTRLSGDTARVADTLVAVVETVVPEMGVLVGMLTITALLDWRLTVVAVGVVPMYAITARIRNRAIGPAQSRARAASGTLASMTTDLLTRIPAVHVFGQGPAEIARYRRASDSTARASLLAIDASARFTPITDLLPGIGLSAALLTGAIEVRNAHITVGGLVVFLAYLSSITRPVQRLARLSATVTRGTVSRDRIAELFAIAPLSATVDVPPGRAESPSASPPSHRPLIAFQDVSYSRGKDRAVFSSLSFTVDTGEFICLSGPSGVGKSTTLALLCRLIDPDSGRITIDGTDLADIPLAILRETLSLVPQDPWLHTGTVAENIRYGRPDADGAEVYRVATRAGVTHFTAGMPHGLHTQVGEHGHQLSGGQQRRVAVARALLRDTPILLLDEPTTGLDQSAENDLIAHLMDLSVGRTVILVTHHPRLARLADRVIELKPAPANPTSDNQPRPSQSDPRLGRLAGSASG